MNILGINSAYHESACCLLQDGVVIACVEEERFSRKKHAKHADVSNPHELPWSAIDFCLSKGDLELSDIDFFAYSFQPEDRLKRQVDIDTHEITTDSWGTEKGEQEFYNNMQKIPQILSEKANYDLSEKFIFLPHHICHAASAYYVSGYDDAAILVVDGIGESASTWLGYGKGNRIEKIREIDYPNSIGFVWEKMSEYLGFSEYHACKVMGLSTFGEWEKMHSEMEKLFYWDDEQGSFFVNSSLLEFRTDSFANLEELFGKKRRKDDAHIYAFHENVAAALQHTTNTIILKLSEELFKTTKSKNLCYAGGVALNCVANAELMKNTQFKNVYIQPAAHDAGTALGAALLTHYKKKDNTQKKRKKVDYSPVNLGPTYSNEEIEEALKNASLSYIRVKEIEKTIAEEIAKGSIVAWFQKGLEFGPRALGHRSILADPRNPVIKDEINKKVKFREIFRPFAPSVLAERVDEWFDISKDTNALRYMLVAVNTKKAKRDLIPAVTHVDHTSRIQQVYKEEAPQYHKLILCFEKITGIPMVLNTSFNIHEPIVCSPQDAINTFTNSKIDILAIGDFIVERKKEG